MTHKYLLLTLLALISLSACQADHDIPQDIIDKFYSSYDKPDHTSGILTSSGYLKLTKATYDVNIYGSLAEVEITQHYTNNFQQQLNADYIFAISPKAAFISLEAEYDNTLLTGMIKEKSQAKKEYTEEVKKGKKAAYSEIIEGLHDMMILRIGNLSQGGECIIRYKYVEKLSVAMNKFWRLQIPFRISPASTKNTITLEQSMGLQARQDQHNTQNSHIKEKVFVKIHHQSNQNLTFLESPTHQDYIVKKEFPTFTQILLDPSQIKFDSPKNSFELLFRDSLVNKPTYTLTHLPEDYQWPYVAEITFFPDFNKETPEKAFLSYKQKEEQKQQEKIQGEYLFLLDRSGSMQGENIKIARQAVIQAINLLPPKCKYNVISFGMKYQFLFPESKLKHDQKSLDIALSKIKEMEADLGGTDIYSPLEEIYKHHPLEEGFPRSIFLISDGSIFNPDNSVSLIYKNSFSTDQRLYSLGIGDSVDLSLITRSAEAGNGLSEFAKSSHKIVEKLEYLIKDSISETLDKFYIDFDKNSVDTTVPSIESIQSIRKNEAFSMFLFLNDEWKSEEMDITLGYRESLSSKPRKEIITIKKKEALQNNKIFHNLSIKHLLDNILFNAIYSSSPFQNVYSKTTQNSLYNYSVLLSIKYQVLSEFTSFILKEKQSKNKEVSQESEEIQIPNNQNSNQQNMFFSSSQLLSSNFGLQANKYKVRGSSILQAKEANQLEESEDYDEETESESENEQSNRVMYDLSGGWYEEQDPNQKTDPEEPQQFQDSLDRDFRGGFGSLLQFSLFFLLLFVSLSI